VLKLPRGTRDFSPEEMDKRNYIENSIRNIFEIYGYREVETPNIEYLELFTKKSGEAILNELYSFQDKSGRNLTLRPELTAPVIRFYIDKLKMNPKPLKLFYFGKCYRYDRPQKGRYREFKQAGCEIIGSDTPETLAELISMSWHILKKVGICNLTLNIGNLKILSQIFKELKLSENQKDIILPLIDKSLKKDLIETLSEFGIDNKRIDGFLNILDANNIEEIEKFIIDKDKIGDELHKLKKVFQFLNNIFKINFRLKLGIVRGLDYYNGIVFEIENPLLGAESQICGGGQYELLNILGGKETPTSGFAIGFDRVIISLEHEAHKFPIKKLDFYVIPINERLIEKGLEIIQLLRERNIKADIDLLRRGISKSLKYASSINARNAIIVGPDELENNSITLRDMITGKQEIIKINKFIESL